MGEVVQIEQVESDGFYRAFEEKFRGSRELIKSRLHAYLPFVEALKLMATSLDAVDLGCGRGEWLEVLVGLGFNARGVDLDDGMLAACHERGLNASRGDAIEFLRGLPDASQVLISGIHLAEHLPFFQLRNLVREAIRVLQPGGLLILETPNPENPNVAGNTFHLDPTHKAPLPPELLSFLPEYYGFARVKVLRLQERHDLVKAPTISLRDVLTGASPDYSIVAQKAATDDIMELTGPAFELEYGLTLDQLLDRFDAQNAQQVARTMDLAKALERTTKTLAQDVARKNSIIDAREAENNQLKQHLSEATAEINKLKQEIASLYGSTSWKVTTPLRSLSRLAIWIARGGRAWGTLKPGSRPMRLLSLLLPRNISRTNCSQNIEETAALGARLPDSSTEMPLVLDAELKTPTRTRGLIVLDRIDTSAEPEAVQSVYQQLTDIRKRHLKRI
jgi:O-antigen chain-terminating methyltransferase